MVGGGEAVEALIFLGGCVVGVLAAVGVFIVLILKYGPRW